MKRKVILKLPVLKVSGKGTLKDKWFIEYQIRNPKTDILERHRIQEGLNKIPKKKDRLVLSDKIIKEYSEKLKSGWTPWSDENVVYEDEIEYNNIAKIYGRERKSNNTIRRYLSEFLLAKKVQVNSKTYESYQSKSRLFCQYLEKNNLHENDIRTIDNDIVIGFFEYLINSRKLTERTCEKYKQNLDQMFKYFIKKKYIFENPIQDIPKSNIRRDMAARPILKEDFNKLISAIKEENYQLFIACMFIYYCALRPTKELRLLKIKDIDLYNSNIRIASENAKNKKTQLINLPKQLRDLCLEYGINRYNKEFYVFGREFTPGPDKLGKNTLNNRFRAIRKKLNMSDDYKLYSMKHTGASYLLEAGFAIDELKNHFRHADISTTYEYVKNRIGVRSEKIINTFPTPPGV